MKIIFLDIDGVLNRKSTPNPRKLPYVVDKRLLARLKKLLERTGAKVSRVKINRATSFWLVVQAV